MPRAAGGAAAVTRVTAAPREAASSAMALPIFPEERLPTKRTGSIGSRVPPAVTSTRQPARAPPPRAFSRAAKISSGSTMRPGPLSPPARGPLAGPTIVTPSASREARLRRVAGCDHISLCIAGATTTGTRAASTTAESRSSLRPWASRAMVAAVAGAMHTASAQRARSR